MLPPSSGSLCADVSRAPSRLITHRNCSNWIVRKPQEDEFKRKKMIAVLCKDNGCWDSAVYTHRSTPRSAGTEAEDSVTLRCSPTRGPNHNTGGMLHKHFR